MGVQVVKHRLDLGKHRAGAGKVGRGLGDAHDAAQLQAWQQRHLLGQRQRLGRRDARLGVAPIYIDLNTDLQRRQVGRALLAQALCNFEPVHRLHPVKVLGNQARLVALNGANAMPLQR